MFFSQTLFYKKCFSELLWAVIIPNKHTQQWTTFSKTTVGTSRPTAIGKVSQESLTIFIRCTLKGLVLAGTGLGVAANIICNRFTSANGHGDGSKYGKPPS